MYCVRNVTEDLYWIGANDHRLSLFENIHPIPEGVSYNAYVLMDEKTVLFDTIDWSSCRQFLENLEHVLNGRPLDGYQPYGAGPRRFHRGSSSSLSKCDHYQHGKSLYADAPV